jgi:transposase
VTDPSRNQPQRRLGGIAGHVPAEWPVNFAGIRKFGPSAWTIGLWVKQAARDAGDGDGGLSSAEREELKRLRRENRQLKEDREILSKAAAWFATEKAPTRRSSDS